MSTERITPAELETVRDRHGDIRQETLLELGLTTIICRFILDDGETCRGGYYIEDHHLTPDGWLHPTEFDPRTGRPVWPEDTE